MTSNQVTNLSDDIGTIEAVIPSLECELDELKSDLNDSEHFGVEIEQLADLIDSLREKVNRMNAELSEVPDEQIREITRYRGAHMDIIANRGYGRVRRTTRHGYNVPVIDWYGRTYGVVPERKPRAWQLSQEAWFWEHIYFPQKMHDGTIKGVRP